MIYKSNKVRFMLLLRVFNSLTTCLTINCIVYMNLSSIYRSCYLSRLRLTTRVIFIWVLLFTCILFVMCCCFLIVFVGGCLCHFLVSWCNKICKFWTVSFRIWIGQFSVITITLLLFRIWFFFILLCITASMLRYHMKLLLITISFVYNFLIINLILLILICLVTSRWIRWINILITTVLFACSYDLMFLCIMFELLFRLLLLILC